MFVASKKGTGLFQPVVNLVLLAADGQNARVIINEAVKGLVVDEGRAN